MSYLDDHLDRLAEQTDRRRRQLGHRAPACRTCPEADPLALAGVDDAIQCYECSADAGGRAVVERHHVSGRANAPDQVVDVLGNDHRVLSAFQASWPRATLRNPDASPLLNAAAAIRGWQDTMALILDRGIGWIAPFLEWLDDALTRTLGMAYWNSLGWQDTDHA
jgi:hypothetical protein